MVGEKINIVTLTLSPSVDRTASVRELVPEKKLHCYDLKYEPGGGGINVSRALHKLGSTSMAVFPKSGCNGTLFEELLLKETIKIHPISAKNETRENIIIFEEKSQNQFRFGMPASPLTEDEVRTCLAYLQHIDDMAYLVLSGSIPPGVSPNSIAKFAQIAVDKNAKLVVDTSGTALKFAIEIGAFLIKPNLNELASLVGKDNIQKSQVKDIALDVIHQYNVENIVVSMGGEGAVLVNKKDHFICPAPKVKRVSTVGAGDSMLAGIIHSLSQGKDLKHSFIYGIASGSAATLNPGTELCKKVDADRLYSELIKQ